MATRCPECARHARDLAIKQGDLYHAAKVATARPSRQNVTAVVTARRQRDLTRRWLIAHQDECAALAGGAA